MIKKISFFNIITLSILSLVLAAVSEYFLDVSDLLTANLSSDFSQRDIEDILRSRTQWSWLGYLFNFLLLIIKILLVSTVLYIGTFFFEKPVFFKNIVGISVKAEFIFLLVGITKFIWFYFFQTHYDLDDIQYFYPFSALSLIGYKGLDPWFIYPLQVLNLFELAYWFVLAFLLGKELDVSMDKGFKIIASSYGPALLIWIVLVMFFLLNFS